MVILSSKAPQCQLILEISGWGFIRLNIELCGLSINDKFGVNKMAKFKQGDHVRKKSGSEWQGYIVGWYSTKLTTEGYAVESESHAGSVQIYPANALEFVNDLESKTDA